jgi:hypothetical protein
MMVVVVVVVVVSIVVTVIAHTPRFGRRPLILSAVAVCAASASGTDGPWPASRPPDEKTL